jgi:transcriptional antiterminator NusG
MARFDSSGAPLFVEEMNFRLRPKWNKGVRRMAKRWYSVSVLSNFEKKIAEQIRQAVIDESLEDEIEEVLVPTEEVIEVRRGKKVTTERRFMPGYVLVRMEMSDQGYHLINSINRVTGFLGPQGRPMPMRDAEVNAILNRVQEGEESPRTLIHFDIGEKVKVNDGPFEDFDGLVEEVDDENQRLKVTVSIFGRATPVELEFTQVSKQS